MSMKYLGAPRTLQCGADHQKDQGPMLHRLMPIERTRGSKDPDLGNTVQAAAASKLNYFDHHTKGISVPSLLPHFSAARIKKSKEKEGPISTESNASSPCLGVGVSG